MTGQQYFDATAFPFELAEEGGYNPNDPSMHGVLQTTYDDFRRANGLPTQDVRLIGDDEVYSIYLNNYYLAGGAGGIADSGNTALALVHFDAGVNQGVSAANAMLSQSGGDVPTYLTLRQQRYQALAAADPAKHGADLPVWLQRLADVQSAIQGGVGLGGEAVIAGLMLAGLFLLVRSRKGRKSS